MSSFRTVSLGLLLGLSTVAALPAQMTREQIAAESAKHPPLPRPSNLQVLPPDIAIPDLIVTMVGFSEGLAVQCPYCHEFTPDHKELNFPSDGNPNKVKARVMLRMVNDINAKYVAQLATPHKGTAVGCGTCHQGNQIPPAYKPPAGFVVK